MTFFYSISDDNSAESPRQRCGCCHLFFLIRRIVVLFNELSSLSYVRSDSFFERNRPLRARTVPIKTKNNPAQLLSLGGAVFYGFAQEKKTEN